MAVRRRSVVIDLTEEEGAPAPVVQKSHSTPKRPASNLSSTLSPEGKRFLDNLENFLAVGCLVFSTSPSDGSPDFEEVFDISTISNLSETLAIDIQKLLAQARIRVFAAKPHGLVLRVYVLPGDVGHRFLRHDRKLDSHLFSLLKELDISTDAWYGCPSLTSRQSFDLCATGEDGSLYYMFNNIPSPDPLPGNVKNRFYQAAMSMLLSSSLPGLRTTLYPYQRRSAGLMLQRECEDRLELDPRLEERATLNGLTYYYDPWNISFLRSPRFYEACKGGVLAETMGLGKTVICIALILSTKGHLPKVPAQYDSVTSRPKVGSLVEMAISSINRHSAPWRTFFERHEELTGEYLAHCIKLMRLNAPSYAIPSEPVRWNRKTSVPPPKRLTLAATTIVVVPRNLLSQWRSELDKHTESESLRVLVMDDNKMELPAPDELALYDAILFSRPRFEFENRDGADSRGRRMSKYPVLCNCPYIGASRTRDCHCVRVDDLYNSPLKSLHFLRIIIDEGHGVASENTKLAQVASKLIEASHRWVISGTPAKDLLGAEMDLVASGSGKSGLHDDTESVRRDALNQRKDYVAKDERDGPVQNIGSLASNYLKIRPWCPGDGERSADWKDHFYRHEMLRPGLRTFTSFSRCLRQTLESIVIRTRPADVERDIDLPPLSHEIIRLEPSFYDKLTVNAFIFVLTANAVTSERTDVDYVFHKNSGKARTQLFNNLRSSAFFWTGFSAADIEAAQEQSKRYLQQRDKLCSPDDEDILTRCIDQANTMLNSAGWRALSASHEIGLYLEDWPADSAEFWSFNNQSSPLLCGATQLVQAQDYTNRQAASENPAEGLAGAGLRALSVLRAPSPVTQVKDGSNILVKSGLPSSSLASNQGTQKRSLVLKSPSKQQSSPGKSPSKSPKGKALDGPTTAEVIAQLPVDSALRRTRIVGTTSAKLSYLISRILEFHEEEKILVFYDSDNVAYYIAQVLEVLHINHLIYAKSLTPALKSEYVVRFNQQPQIRVLLMDIHQAAYGLNFPCASRVFFVNPVNRPNDEAQALKRAHRIGQTRKVYAETLILKDTIEEDMFERATKMSRSEHKSARELEDDGGIRHIIQTAQPIPVSTSESEGYGAVALIDTPQQFFGREGWATWKVLSKENSRPDTPVPLVPAETGNKKRNAEPEVGSGRSQKRHRKASVVAPTGDGVSVVIDTRKGVEGGGHASMQTESYNSIFGGA